MTNPKPRQERLSGLATISRHLVTFTVDDAVISGKSADASANPRLREILVLHEGNADPLQRMLNAIEPGSYVRPHRHQVPRAESMVLLRGSLGFVAFFDDGRPDFENSAWLSREACGVSNASTLQSAQRASGLSDPSVPSCPSIPSIAVDCRAPLWHTFFALEANTVLFEVKPGPFDPLTDKEFAPWAPAETAPDAQEYLHRLESDFRSRFLL